MATTKKAKPAVKKVKKKVNPAFLKAGQAWREHLNAFREAHPKMIMSECMKKAKLTYKKK